MKKEKPTMFGKIYEPNKKIDYNYVTLYLGDVKTLYRHLSYIQHFSPDCELGTIAEKLKMVIDHEMFEINLVK